MPEIVDPTSKQTVLENEPPVSAPMSALATRRIGREHYYPEATDPEWSDWRWQFKHRVTTLEELAKKLDIPPHEWEARAQVLRDFRMGITPYYLSLIDADDPHDPILRQVVPLEEEFRYRAVGDEDPLGEENFSPVPGITHRYPDRALMVISNNCAIYCRYCTRKRTMYEGATPDVEIDRMVEYIAKTPQIRDVIVSGGDPLNYSNQKLESILAKLRAVPHLEIIRIGTRVPVALPQRIDDELVDMLQRYHPLWINVHFNHPRELTPETARACDKLSRAGIPLNNQAVLLRGVNDSVSTMRALCTGLMKQRVRPYYLYQCDPVRGAEHFRTPISKGLEIIEGLRGHISGLAVPTYVVDAPGGGGKIPVQPDYLLRYEPKSGRALLRNFAGKLYEYIEPLRVGDEIRPRKKRSGPVESVHKDGEPAGGADAAAKVVGKSRWVHRGAAPRRPLGGGPDSNGKSKA
jgi:lysine 2,3-aminomutase